MHSPNTDVHVFNLCQCRCDIDVLSTVVLDVLLEVRFKEKLRRFYGYHQEDNETVGTLVTIHPRDVFET